MTNFSPKDLKIYSNHSMAIDNLSSLVLLEIFDLYRHTFGDPLSSERVWNNKNGWFKLAHVCRDWRSLVLSSPSRLRLRLYFADNTPTRAAVLIPLSHLPIIVDYCNVIWNSKTQRQLISAVRYPDRVCKISIRGSEAYEDDKSDRVFKVLDQSFPALESLKLDNIFGVKRVLLSQSFMTSIRSLRRLRLDEVCLASLYSMLSVTTSLVDLTLDIDTLFLLTKGATFLTHLQNMPHLRNLQVYTQVCPTIELPPTTSVLLPALTSFRIFGECPEIEWFASGLNTPSLREFHLHVADNGNGNLRIPYLSKFMHSSKIAFFAARLSFSGQYLTTCLCAHPYSIDHPPSKTVTIMTHLLSDPGSALSAMIATLEDIFFYYESKPSDLVPWREFLEQFRNVKVLRLHHGLEKQVADMFRQPPVIPPPSGGEVDLDATSSTDRNMNQFTLDIFPSLVEIMVYTRTSASIGEMVRASVLESFGPFVTARCEMGRPVKVFWNADGEVPRYADAGRYRIIRT